MKKILFTRLCIVITAILTVNVAFSQSAIDYRRSSLSFILIEDDGLGDSRDMVVEAYSSNEFPNQYNNHLLKDSKFVSEEVKPTIEDCLASGWYKDTLRSTKDFLVALKKPLNSLRYTKADSSEALLEPNKKEMLQIKMDKFIRDQNLAKQVVASWFNRDASTGNMDWDLIKERGKYSASEEKLDQAKSVADETSFLMDFELIGNTYTVFNKMEFYANEPVARLLAEAGKAEVMESMAGKPQILLDKALEGIEKIYEKTKEGYTVKCNSFLYQLDWDETIAERTKQTFFPDGESIDLKAAWDTTNLYNLSFVGKTTVASIVTFKIGETRTEEQIIDLQVKRTMDNAIAKLQKKYIQFRPVAPVSSVEPLTARIGMKQGVEKKQKWEILEMSINELGLPEWKSIGKSSVDKKAPIWDNTQGAEVQTDEAGQPLEVIEFTTFAGGKNAQPGLHFIRLIK
ncbi:MAG: hypothetical protein QNL21_05140 [Flavobacteriales bacterium]